MAKLTIEQRLRKQELLSEVLFKDATYTGFMISLLIKRLELDNATDKSKIEAEIKSLSGCVRDSRLRADLARDSLTEFLNQNENQNNG